MVEKHKDVIRLNLIRIYYEINSNQIMIKKLFD